MGHIQVKDRAAVALARNGADPVGDTLEGRPDLQLPELMSGTVVPATPGCRATYDVCVVL
jgi:hypothetical protein